MLIQLKNLPDDVTDEDIDNLCQHSHLIKSIHILNNGHSAALLEIDCHSHVAINAICHLLSNKYLHGHHLTAYPSLYSH